MNTKLTRRHPRSTDDGPLVLERGIPRQAVVIFSVR
jgi:hypothetical protein